MLRLLLAKDVRETLTAWLRAYGAANGLPGLATGPLEARFQRLREHGGAEEMVIWTTPERRAAGHGPSIRVPALHLDLGCKFIDGHIIVVSLAPMPPDAREAQRERGSVGIVMQVGRIELPPEIERPDPLAQEIEGTFDRLTGNRWRGFVQPLREALEAEARDDLERAQRIAAPYERAEPRMGGRGQESPYRLLGIAASQVAAFEEGEWLDILNDRGGAVATARLVNSDVGGGALDVDVRGADPPSPGVVRPRPRTKILAQKRAILGELESPTGNLPLLARLMASPAAMPIARPLFPENWLNQNVGRSRSQSRAVALALGLDEGEALLIEGPPGTGKSTTTGEMVAQILSRDPMARILVCSHSNHGTDNMLMKVVPYVPGAEGSFDKVPALRPARVGMLERVSSDLRRFFVQPDEDLSDRNVIFTTIDALALNDAAGANVYDYVVLDEANRATVLDSLVALARGRRFILVGDRLQLQPVLSEAEEQLRLEPALARAGVIGKSLFVWLTERHFPDRAVVFLDEQNRMHPQIGGLIARAFYDDKLRNGPAAPRRDTGVPHFGHPAVWVDTRGLKGLRESRNRGPSLYNLPEARLVTTITRHLLRAAPDGVDVGVIAAYAEQAALLRRLLRGESGMNPTRKLEIDTVDAFEGREKDIVVVSLVRSNRRREIGFLQLMQRINVALSRARRLLIVVGDTATLRGSYFDKILRYLRERGAVTPGPRVIAQLRGGAQPREGDQSRERGRGRHRDRHRRRDQVAGPPEEGAIATPAEGVAEPSAEELGDELPQLPGRRPNRQRRSPAEILARLNQEIQPGAEAASAESPNGLAEAADAEAVVADVADRLAADGEAPKPRRGRARGRRGRGGAEAEPAEVGAGPEMGPVAEAPPAVSIPEPDAGAAEPEGVPAPRRRSGSRGGRAKKAAAAEAPAATALVPLEPPAPGALVPLEPPAPGPLVPVEPPAAPVAREPAATTVAPRRVRASRPKKAAPSGELAAVVEPAIPVELPVSDPSINGAAPRRRSTRRAAKSAPGVDEASEG
ncbi:MAG TPA: AAA domain-containing protein [Chloroflexota bacterium]